MMHVVRILATSIAIAIAQNAGHFDYDAKAPLGLTEVGVEHRAAADVHDITYASPRGGCVPAYLVVPKGRGHLRPSSGATGTGKTLRSATALSSSRRLRHWRRPASC